MVVVSILVFGPWGLLQEDEGFLSPTQEHILQYNIMLNQTLMYLPQAWGLPPLFSKPQTIALGSYNAAVGGTLYADTLVEQYQRREITPEEFEIQMLENFNDTSITIQKEYASVIDNADFTILSNPVGMCPPGYTYDSTAGMCMPDV